MKDEEKVEKKDTIQTETENKNGGITDVRF